MGLHDLDLMRDIRKQLNKNFEFGDKIILYGEPWKKNTHISVKGFNIPMCDKTNYEISYKIYEFENKKIVIILIGARENFYKELKKYIKDVL